MLFHLALRMNAKHQEPLSNQAAKGRPPDPAAPEPAAPDAARGTACPLAFTGQSMPEQS